MITVVEVKRSQNESTASLIRRFSKRVQGLNLIRRVKGRQFAERSKSNYKKKQQALKRLAKWGEINRLKKLGKIADVSNQKSH